MQKARRKLQAAEAHVSAMNTKKYMVGLITTQHLTGEYCTNREIYLLTQTYFILVTEMQKGVRVSGNTTQKPCQEKKTKHETRKQEEQKIHGRQDRVQGKARPR